MDPRSEAMLAHVHPDLCAVIRAAAQAPQPFEVTYGIRTLAAEEELVARHLSETLHSRHLPDAHFAGQAMAVDVTPLINGEISFAPGREASVYGQVAAQILAAAVDLKVDIQWGGAAFGAWVDGVASGFRDWGHFQLDPSSYA